MMRFTLLLFLCSWLQCQAHVVQQLFVDFETQEETWTATIRFDAGIALPEMRADKEALQPKREWLLDQSASHHKQLRTEAEKYIRECIHFSSEGNTLDYHISFPEWDTDPPTFRSPFTDLGFAYFDMKLSGKLPEHSLHVRVSTGEHPDFVFSDGHHFTVVEPEQSQTIWLNSLSAPSDTISFWNFLHYGYRHVLPKGWDHVLFIAALCCLSFRWRPLLAQSLIFTIGHTITMALSITSTLPILSPSSIQWVEICIAATIVYVALENVFSAKIRPHRLLTIFIFGLIHGLGFAAVLGNTIRSSEHIALPLVAANLGVELGQITVIGIMLIALIWFHQKPYFRKILQSISTLIALTGIYWVIERVS